MPDLLYLADWLQDQYGERPFNVPEGLGDVAEDPMSIDDDSHAGPSSIKNVPYENEDNRYNPDLPPVPRGVEIEREIPPNIFEDGTHQDLVLHPWDLISHSTTNSGSDLDPDWWSIVGEKDYDTTYFWEPPNLGNTEAADGNAPPVYHWQIWDDLIKAVNNNGTDQYRYEPERGLQEKDITAYHDGQEYWGPDRTNRPYNLTLWEPDPNGDPTYTVQDLKFRNRTVLDWRGQPIKHFYVLPMTISSAVAGWRVEAWMRQDRRIKFPDIMARMFTRINARGQRQPVHFDKHLADSTRAFRLTAGCMIWRQKNLMCNIEMEFLDRQRTPEQRALNRTVQQDLTAAEYRDLRLAISIAFDEKKSEIARSRARAAAGSQARLDEEGRGNSTR